jgi:hypothetical protein
LTGGYLKKDKEQLMAERHELEARVLTPANIAYLMRRVEAYYSLEKEGDCAGTYAILTLDLREGGYDKEGWVHTCEHINGGRRILDWHVDRMIGLGNRVKVYVRENHKMLRGREKGQIHSDKWEDYWVFEDGTWNFGLGVTPEGWNDKLATEIPIPPQHPPDPPRPEAP